MKLLIVLALVAAVCAAPYPKPRIWTYPQRVPIHRYNNENSGPRQWNSFVEPTRSIAWCTWVGPDGVKYSIPYITDDFQQGPGGGGGPPPAVVASLLG